MDFIDYFSRPHPRFTGEHPLRCPGCGRTGTLRTVEDTKVIIGHTCPGPWVLEGTEPAQYSPWRMTFYGDAARAALSPTMEDQR